MASKKEKICLPRGEKGLSKEEKSTPGSPMSESDNKMNNISRNYSSHNFIEMHPNCPMHYSLKKFLGIACHRIPKQWNWTALYAPDANASGMYYNTSPLSQNYSLCLNMDYYLDYSFRHPPPPITIRYVTIMPCWRSHKRNFPTTPLYVPVPPLSHTMTVTYKQQFRWSNWLLTGRDKLIFISMKNTKHLFLFIRLVSYRCMIMYQCLSWLLPHGVWAMI